MNNVKTFGHKLAQYLCVSFSLLMLVLGSSASAKNQHENQSQYVVEALNNIHSSTAQDLTKVKSLLPLAEDELLVKVKLKLASIYRSSGQLDEAISIIDELLATRNEFNQDTQIDIFMGSAYLERSRNNYQKAEEIVTLSVLPMVHEDSLKLANIYRSLGLFLRYQYKLSEAKKYYELAEQHYIKHGDEAGLAKTYGSLGVLYESLDDLVRALQYQQKARHILEKTGEDKSGLATNYFNLGEIYFRSKEFEAALEFFLRALELDQALNDLNDVAFDHHRIATIYMEMTSYTQALQHTQTAIKLLIKLRAHQALSRSYIQLADIYKLLKEPENRLQSLLLAQAANEKAPTNLQQRWVWTSLAQYYFDVADFQQAQLFATKSLEKSKHLQTNRFLYTDHKLLAGIYREQGDFERAFTHMQLALESQQALNNEQQIKETERHKKDVNLLEEQLKVEELERQKALQNEKLTTEKATNQRNTVLFLVALLLLGITAYLAWQKRKMALLEAKLYADVLAKKDKLLADVSHELRTPLTALKIQIDALQHNLVKDVDASYEKLSAKVMDINRLISDIYQLAQADTGSIELNIQRLNATDLITYWCEEFSDVVKSKGFDWQQELVPSASQVNIDPERLKQVIENLLSNSCFYTDKPGTVSLSTYCEGQALCIEVNDSSPGVEEQYLEQIFSRLFRMEQSRSRQTGGSGLGLAICRELIEAQNGKIVAHNSELGGLKVVISLPLAT